MKSMPTGDDCPRTGKIRDDGRKMPPVYLFGVKEPSESKHEEDLYKPIATTLAEDAWRPLSKGRCPLMEV